MRCLAILLVCFGTLGALALECAICGQTIQGKYLNANGKIFCSEACYEKTLPQCFLCGRRFREGVQVTGHPDKVYCKECGAKPTCFNCQLPSDCEKLDDGRNICRICRADAIFDQAQAQEIFNRVRERMRRDLNLWTDRTIHFSLVSLPELSKLSSSHGQSTPGEELGLYSYTFTEITTTGKRFPWNKPLDSVRIADERFAIYALYGLTEARLIEVSAHELAHDWMQKNYPHVRDLKLREGFAEYVAHKVNSLFGNAAINVRIEKNPDPVYGDGFRETAARVRLHGFDGLLEYFAKLNKKE